MYDNEKEKWQTNEILKVQFEPTIEGSGDGFFDTPIKHLKFKKRENNDLTVGKVEQLTTAPKITYIDYINMVEKENTYLKQENQQLKQRIRELEEKLEFEKLMDDDLK